VKIIGFHVRVWGLENPKPLNKKTLKPNFFEGQFCMMVVQFYLTIEVILV
jgi:hypothetical protein